MDRGDRAVGHGMQGDNSRRAVEQLLVAMEARDWSTLGDTVGHDVVYHLPQSGERFVGRDAYLSFNKTYPGEWHLSVERLLAEGAQVAAVLTVRVAEETQTALAWYDVDHDGIVREITEWWPEPYDPPDRTADA